MNMANKKIGVLSLGCARNLVDSEVILGRLKAKGYPIVDVEEADIALVNTCAFIKEAKEESIEAILDLIELKKLGRLEKIIVAGCLVQRYKQRLLKLLPEIDAFMGTISLNHNQARFRITPGHYAYVKICEGCINYCSFCTIPKIKPEFKSCPLGTIISEVKKLDEQGCCEVNLIGQDITAYGWDLYGEFKLTGLIREIIKSSKKIHWLRLLYLSPERIGDELIELIAAHPRIVKYIDLPLQHINDRILEKMNRRMTKEKILRLINKIRKQIPNIAIRTSFIVGFPGETERQFCELLEFIKKTKFERLGLFLYSREEETSAAGFRGQIPQKLKEERFRIIMSAQQEISRSINEKFLGQHLEVLIEEKDKDGFYIGRSQFDAPEVDGLVYVKTKSQLHSGQFVRVKITDTLEYDLVGEAE